MNKILESFIEYSFEPFSEKQMIGRSYRFYQFMNRRRTVREFSNKSVPNDVIKSIIKTAGTSPSGAHKQPWHFCVVTDAKIKHSIRVAAEEEERINYDNRFPDDWLEDLFHFGTDENKEYLDTAPVLIVVFKENYQFIDAKKRKNYYVNESVGIAAGILITAIHNAGLTTLTHTPNPMKFLNDILNRPKNETPILLMPVGYPKSGTRIPDLKRKSIDEILTWY